MYLEAKTVGAELGLLEDVEIVWLKLELVACSV